jgi:hypothetical protein
VNIPKNEENNAGNTTGIRVSNTTTRVQKNTAYETIGEFSNSLIQKIVCIGQLNGFGSMCSDLHQFFKIN